MTLYNAGASFPSRNVPLTDWEQRQRVVGQLLSIGGGANGDGTAALNVATALLLALLARERLGVSQQIRIPMLDSNALATSALTIQYKNKQPGRSVDPERRGFDALERVYETRDGWIFLGATFEEGWQALGAAFDELSNSEVKLIQDPRFGSKQDRSKHDDELKGILSSFFKARTADEWETTCIERKVPCVKVEPPSSRVDFVPVFQAALPLDNPSIVDAGFVHEVEHPLFGPHPRLAPLVHLSLTPGVSKPGCLIGQHTAEILRELGYTPKAITELEGKKIILNG